MSKPEEKEIQSADALISVMNKPTEADKALVRKAYTFAENAHKNHKRNYRFHILPPLRLSLSVVCGNAVCEY